ncbi:MAG: acetyl-coenzyme A synthetase, partial [Gammaproteobacteria bacterium]|nr:acetyl-coenzyme A synthetase [Gammaproteobacteria bacterium]
MSDKLYDIPDSIKKSTHINEQKYQEMYQQSINDPDTFWAAQAEEFLSWSKPWDKVSDWSYAKDNLYIKWFEGGKLNVTYNCIDRHLEKRGDAVAIIWEGDNPNDDKKITYKEL